MTGDRIRTLRKDILKSSQIEFGKKLGVSNDVIYSIEKNRVVPSESILKLICKTFGVSYNWLKNGEGDMTDRSDIDLIEEIEALTMGTDEKTRTALKIAASFTNEEWKMIDKIVEKIIKGIDKNTLLSYIEEKYKK